MLQVAKSGSINKIVVYWGNIETSVKLKVGATVSWIPVVGWFVPDSEQVMRISLTALISDVDNESWDILVIKSNETKATTSTFTRSGIDDEQVAKLKEDVYGKLIDRITSETLANQSVNSSP